MKINFGIYFVKMLYLFNILIVNISLLIDCKAFCVYNSCKIIHHNNYVLISKI